MTVKRPRSKIIGAVVGITALGTVCQFLGGTSAVAAPAAASNATKSVIVVLRDQLAATPATTAHVSARRTKATSAQDAVINRLVARGGAKPSDVTHYTAANAFSLTVTAAQAAALAADPSVASVIPNTKMTVPVTATAPQQAVSPKLKTVTPALGTPASSAICPTDPSKPLLEPEALEDTNTASDDPKVKTAQQLVTGTGVKVAYLADAINPNNPDFIRADGSHVITDYKAFSADGPTPDEGGAEAYGDASSIAAQGLVSHDLSTFVNPAYPLPAGCNIRILGMAPGASIVALKIDFYTTSIVQAIDYAVTTDHVDVINESFGGGPVPDAAARSAISVFNDNAIAAGATVTVSSGDAGTTSTIGNPATDPNVISVAASTNNRGYAQTGYAGARYFSNGTWVNDQISSLSSGGFTQSGGTVTLTAPGESGWAACDAGAPECANYNGTGSDFQLFGGTSQSAPLTAGAAALVIAAYRSTHGGTSPTPALVKTLLASTATDLGVPTFEQGAGLLNSRAAVEAALTYPGGTTAPAGVAANIALSTNQLDFSGAPGSTQTSTITVQNVGKQSLTVTPGTRDFKTTGTQTSTTYLDPTQGPTFPYPTTGAPWVYKKVTFTVPAKTDRLVAAMTWRGAAKVVGTSTVTPVVRLTVLDPSGAFVTNSRPQGGAASANYANLDIRRPVAGTYTAILYTLAGARGYQGNVNLATTSQLAVASGKVSPAKLTLAPGASAPVTVSFKTPTAGGDTSQAVTFVTSNGHRNSVPVVLRTVVPTSSGTGTFAGAITGGNGRAGSASQVFTYAFDVPAGKKDVNAYVKLASDTGDQLEGVLVDPNDETQSIGSNAYTDASGSSIVRQGLNMQLTSANPLPGRWRVIILVQNPVSGKEFAQNFTGTIAFDQARVATSGLPTKSSTKLAAGTPVTAKVTVTNPGIAPINVQVDPRTAALSSIPLVSPFGSQTFDLPDHASPTFIVPPGTKTLTATAAAEVPALVELTSGAQGIDVVGDIDAAKAGATTSTATVDETPGTVSTGIWFTDLNEIGAVDENGAPTASATVDLTANTEGFDSDVTSSTGDFYAVTIDPTADIGTPVTIQPGKSATITVTITPSAAAGTTVNGVLNIITPPAFAYPTFNTTGDVLASVPYSYTVAS